MCASHVGMRGTSYFFLTLELPLPPIPNMLQKTCTSKKKKKKEEERQAKSVKTPRLQEHSLLRNAEKSRICLDLSSFSGLSEKQRLRASLLPGYSSSCCTSDSGAPRPAPPHLCPSRSTQLGLISVGAHNTVSVWCPSTCALSFGNRSLQHLQQAGQS